jgi:hypothetical protein
MVYCTPTDVRGICQISADDLTDIELTAIIVRATAYLNNEIGTLVKNEAADYIDPYRKNLKDGSNTTFYVLDSWNYYIGDRDDDGDVDTDDVQVWVYSPSAGTRTQVTVSSVSAIDGSFTLESAPAAGTSVKYTYRKFPIDVSIPDKLVTEACANLAAILGYMNLRGEDYQKLQLGDLRLDTYTKGMSGPIGIYMAQYSQITHRILSGNYQRGDSIHSLPWEKTYEREPYL